MLPIVVEMSFHVYMLSDEAGSWALLTFHELPWRDLRKPPLTLLPLGKFDLLDDALECAADFGGAARGRLVEEALEDQSAAGGRNHLAGRPGVRGDLDPLVDVVELRFHEDDGRDPAHQLRKEAQLVDRE